VINGYRWVNLEKIFVVKSINTFMQTLRVYVYDQVLKLQINPDQTIVVEDREVYTKPLSIYQGINNTVKLLVKNSDQKAVNITGKTFYAQLLTVPDNDHVASFTAQVVDAAKGVAEITIPVAVTGVARRGFYHLAVRYTENNSAKPAYSDDNYSVLIPVHLQLGYRVPGEVYDLTEDLDLGSIPELVDEIRDLGEF
jgi:hypothetical protein